MGSGLSFEMPVADAVYCFGRALVLGILVSSEALLARHKRVGFGRHLILFSVFTLLMVAEVLGAVLGLGGAYGLRWLETGLWVWYPILSIVGLLGLSFCFDYVRVTRSAMPSLVSGQLARMHGRRFLIAAGTILALGALLTSQAYGLTDPPTSYRDMGRAAFLVHSIQAAVMLLLAWKVRQTTGIWLTALESRIFTLACFSGMLGAVAQVFNGPREHLTTLALTVFVAVLLRDNYRRSEIEAVRAAEERTARALLFHRITTQLKSTSDLQRLYEILMDSLMSNLGAESGAIYILDPQTKTLRPMLVHGPFPSPKPVENPATEANAPPRDYTPVGLGEGVIGEVAETGIPLYIYDDHGAARHYRWNTVPAHTAIALPLRTPEGIYGVVEVVNRIDGSAFGEEDLRFMSLIAEQAGLAIYNARLHEEILQRQRAEEQLKVARQIQLRLIPSDLPQIPGLSLGVQYHAAQQVGGDYFDFYRIDHDHLGIVVFDVAGKGVPGALLMAITGTFLKMATPRSNSPAWVLNEVNAALTAEMRRGLYVTAMYGVLSLSTLQLTLVCAGHPDAIIIRDRDLSCETHKPRGAAIGLLRPNRFRAVMEQETIQLEQGDTLLFYTDGVVEAMNEQGEQFGETRLCEVCKQFARQGARALAAEIVEAVRRHAGSTPQYDDITVVALRIWPEEVAEATLTPEAP